MLEWNCSPKPPLRSPPSPTNDTSTFIFTVLASWVHLGNSPPHNVVSSSHGFVSWYVQSLHKPNSHNFHHYFSLLPTSSHTTHHSKKWERSTSFKKKFKKKNDCYLEVNLISNTFLEATFVIFVFLYLTKLFGPAQNKITMF